MKRKYEGTVKDKYGNIISGATIAVYLSDAGTAANIYLDVDSDVAVTGTTSDTYGNYKFFVSTWDYDYDQTFKILISKTGYTTNTIDNITIEDVCEQAFAVTADKTVSTQVKVPKGVTITVSSGKTLTFSGQFSAGRYQIFDGAGSVLFTNGSVDEVYPEWWGATGDGSTDDSTAINAAITSITTSGGVIKLRPVTYICNITMKSNITLQGSGVNSTLLQSASSSDLDVIKGADFATLTGTAVETPETRGVNFVTLRDFTVDGNKANNTSGYGIRIWGRRHIWENIFVQNCSEDGIFTEFTTHNEFAAGDQRIEPTSYYYNITTAGNDGKGWTFSGPHDSIIVRYNSFNNGSWAFYQTGTYSTIHTGIAWDSWGNTTGSYYFGLGGKFIGITASDDGYEGTGIEIPATNGSTQIIGCIVAGHQTGITVTGQNHYIQGEINRCRNAATIAASTAGDALVLTDVIDCVFNVIGEGNYNAVSYVSATGIITLNGQFDVTSPGATLYTGTFAATHQINLIDITTTSNSLFQIGVGTQISMYGDLYPAADNGYYLGKNDDDTPYAWKGVILKDTTNGKYYRVEVINGTITATDLTD